MTRRKEQRLRRRVRNLERLVEALLEAHEEPQFQGARLTGDSLTEHYEALRAKGNRFVRLRVHPELEQLAGDLMAGTFLRGLLGIVVADDVPESGWEVVPAGHAAPDESRGPIVGGRSGG